MVEQRTQERLTNYDPTDVELLKMFALTVKGLPLGEPNFQGGLRAAAEKFPSLEVFMHHRDIHGLTDRFQKASDSSSFEQLNNARFGIRLTDPSKSEAIKASMRMILTSQGAKCLEAAAVAANSVWGDPTICPE